MSSPEGPLARRTSPGPASAPALNASVPDCRRALFPSGRGAVVSSARPHHRAGGVDVRRAVELIETCPLCGDAGDGPVRRRVSANVAVSAP
jgi:hypothetical protein